MTVALLAPPAGRAAGRHRVGGLGLTPAPALLAERGMHRTDVRSHRASGLRNRATSRRLGLYAAAEPTVELRAVPESAPSAPAAERVTRRSRRDGCMKASAGVAVAATVLALSAVFVVAQVVRALVHLALNVASAAGW